VAAYHRGDYVTALRLWRPLADQGNVHAQFNLGVKYHQGQGQGNRVNAKGDKARNP
jgi:TPR repeat protein